MEMENTALITNFGDCSITLGQGIVSCLIMFALRAILLIISNNKNIPEMFEGGRASSPTEKPINHS